MADNEDKDIRGTISQGEVADYDLLDLYVSYNFAEAEMIRDILLDNQIDCFLHKLEPSQFPLNVGKHAQIRVAVEDDKGDEAAALLQEAIDEGALSGEGHFLYEE